MSHNIIEFDSVTRHLVNVKFIGFRLKLCTSYLSAKRIHSTIAARHLVHHIVYNNLHKVT